MVGCSVAYQILTLEGVGWLVPSFYPLAGTYFSMWFVAASRPKHNNSSSLSLCASLLLSAVAAINKQPTSSYLLTYLIPVPLSIPTYLFRYLYLLYHHHHHHHHDHHVVQISPKLLSISGIHHHSSTRWCHDRLPVTMKHQFSPLEMDVENNNSIFDDRNVDSVQLTPFERTLRKIFLQHDPDRLRDIPRYVERYEGKLSSQSPNQSSYHFSILIYYCKRVSLLIETLSFLHFRRPGERGQTLGQVREEIYGFKN